MAAQTRREALFAERDRLRGRDTTAFLLERGPLLREKARLTDALDALPADADADAAALEQQLARVQRALNRLAQEEADRPEKIRANQQAIEDDVHAEYLRAAKLREQTVQAKVRELVPLLRKVLNGARPDVGIADLLVDFAETARKQAEEKRDAEFVYAGTRARYQPKFLQIPEPSDTASNAAFLARIARVFAPELNTPNGRKRP